MSSANLEGSGGDTSRHVATALFALAIGLGVFAQDQLAYERREALGLALWGIALGCFVIGLWQAKRSTPAAIEPAADQPVPRQTFPLRAEVALFAAVFAAGVFFRFYRIDSIPPGLNHDAGWFGLYAIRITQGAGYTPFVDCCGAVGNESMFLYIIAFFQLLLGPTQFAIQLAAITVGLATLVAFYFFMRRLFDLRLALVATFLLGVSGWHITFSKVGWTAILVPLFVCLTFYFLVKAVQEHRRRDFVLAGIFLGLSLDTYSGARMIPFVAGAYLLYETVRTPSLLRRQYVDLALFGAAALVAFSPLGWYMVNHWDQYTSHSNSLWIGRQIKDAGSLEPLFTNIKNGALLFNFRANGDDFFVGEPLLDMPVAVLFTLGLVLAIARWRQRGNFLLLAMLMLTLAVGIASKPNGNRAIVAVLPTSAFAGLFLFESWRWLGTAYSRYRHWFTIGLAGVLVYVAFTTYDSYLGPNHREQLGFDPEATAVGRYMHRIAGQYEIYATGGGWPQETLTYLSYPGEGDPFVQVYHYTRIEDLSQIPPQANRGTAFIIGHKVGSTGEKVRDTLAQRFPSATADLIWTADKSAGPIADVLLVPPGGGAGANLGPYTPAGAAERDAKRQRDLETIADALLDVRTRTGSFPDTGNAVVVACAYGELGPLCSLQDGVDVEALADARGSPLRHGYWYQSDGSAFTLYASFEALPPPDHACPSRDSTLTDRPNLYCVRH